LVVFQVSQAYNTDFTFVMNVHIFVWTVLASNYSNSFTSQHNGMHNVQEYSR
jgi:hypothetical protein